MTDYYTGTFASRVDIYVYTGYNRMCVCVCVSRGVCAWRVNVRLKIGQVE